MTRRLHSHYDTLRVDRGASPEGLRAAYRRLAQKFHPDKHAGRKAAAVVMAEINLAYEVLSDAKQRAAYDGWLAIEDERLRRGGAVGAGAVFTPDRFGWAGWLVVATSSLALLTVGYVVLATGWPAPATARAATQAARQNEVPRPQAARAGGRPTSTPSTESRP